MDKKDKLLKIIEQIQELYPNLDRLMVDDLNFPRSIIITSQENIEQMAAETGLDLDAVDEYYSEAYGELDEELDEIQLTLLDYDDEDSGDGGPLQ